jgi:hypothetical protein
MNGLRIMTAGLLLAAASTAAYAFQEQRQSAPGAAPAATPAQIPVAPQAGDDLARVARGPQGTEIRIPGLGRLGTLPKLDFGMELLYGANDQRQPVAPEKTDDTEGVMIRGSVKHKF